MIQEAIDTCPVNCVHWVDYKELKKLEAEREFQVIPVAGFPVSKGVIAAQQRRLQQQKQQKRS